MIRGRPSRREPPAAEGAVLMGAVEDHRLEEVAAKALLRLQEISPFPFVAEQEQAAISVYPLVSLPVKRASIETERTELRVFLGEKRSPVPPLPAGREEGPCVSLAVDPSMASDLLAFFPLLREDYGRIAECLALLPSFRANLHLEEDRLLLRLNRLSNGPGSHRNGPLDSQRNAPQPDDALTSLDTSP